MIAGRYSLEREIGRGGTGAVWQGRDEVLGRVVALKQIGRLPGSEDTDLARAEREARLGASLNHQHVVAVFDVVTDPETGGRWLVMEYVDGLTLGRLVQEQGRLSPDEAAPLLWQAADALVAAHAAGIAHRDVKPSNILVGRDGQVKLTDFGIAQVAADPALTQTGLVTGSPAYLAPEVAMGGRGDAASDVWSLGATAFHLLAGRPPYEVGDNVLGALYRIVHEDPPRLSDAGWMAPVVEGTLVRDPARRWSMTQVRDFLARPGSTAVPLAATTVTSDDADDGETQVLTTDSRGATPWLASRRPLTALLVIGLAAVVLAVLLFSVLSRGTSGKGGAGADGGAPSARPSAAPGPTARGMEAFIRDYVRTVGDDPDAAWAMLTPKFQRESGGLDTYRRFWAPASNGRVLSITADPGALVVSYQVRFDNFHNGPGPTVLVLTYDHGRYLIDGERTKGFVPKG